MKKLQYVPAVITTDSVKNCDNVRRLVSTLLNYKVNCELQYKMFAESTNTSTVHSSYLTQYPCPNVLTLRLPSLTKFKGGPVDWGSNWENDKYFIATYLLNPMVKEF